LWHRRLIGWYKCNTDWALVELYHGHETQNVAYPNTHYITYQKQFYFYPQNKSNSPDPELTFKIRLQNT
jgi:hypothetical protein